MSSVSVPETFTRTQLRVIERLVHGDYPKLACIKSGLPGWHTERFITPEMLAEVARISATLTEQAREKCLADAGEIHEFLSDAFRCRMSDIRNDDHTFKPRSEWPEIWDRLEESGEVEVTYEKVRSHDGEDKEGIGGWETTGRVVEKVKLKFSSKVKLVELLMKHKAVDAMVKQGDRPLSPGEREITIRWGAASDVIDVTPPKELK
jgi:hypothetical protein